MYNQYSYWQMRHILAEWGYRLVKQYYYKDRCGHHNIVAEDGTIAVKDITLPQLRVLLTRLHIPADYDPGLPPKKPAGKKKEQQDLQEEQHG